jgi:hypothetical protein
LSELRKLHWEHVYSSKDPTEVSWYQGAPQLSLQMIAATGVETGGAIIDVGGGASTLVDNLIDAGYTTSLFWISPRQRWRVLVLDSAMPQKKSRGLSRMSFTLSRTDPSNFGTIVRCSISLPRRVTSDTMLTCYKRPSNRVGM